MSLRIQELVSGRTRLTEGPSWCSQEPFMLFLQKKKKTTYELCSPWGDSSDCWIQQLKGCGLINPYDFLSLLISRLQPSDAFASHILLQPEEPRMICEGTPDWRSGVSVFLNWTIHFGGVSCLHFCVVLLLVGEGFENDIFSSKFWLTIPDRPWSYLRILPPLVTVVLQ